MEETIYLRYICAHCKDEWEGEQYYEEDEVPLAYSTCPLCNMGIWEMLVEVYERDGVKGAVVQLFRRIFYRLK